MSNLSNKGERLVTDGFDRFSIEHLHRYALAAELCREKTVLDIASGEGYGSNLLAKMGSRVTGVDISELAVEHAQNKYRSRNLDFLTGSAGSIPLADKSVDRVVSFETLEHHSQHEEMFREIKRVLKPDGILIISTPDKLNYTDVPKTINEFHVKELYADEFRHLASDHFRNVTLLFQRIGYYDIICPERLPSTALTEYSGDFHQVGGVKLLQTPIYNICLASDSELPDVGCSIFSGDRVTVDSDLKARQQLEAATSALVTAQNLLRDTQRSLSFRIGRTLTRPLRLLLGRD